MNPHLKRKQINIWLPFRYVLMIRDNQTGPWENKLSVALGRRPSRSTSTTQNKPTPDYKGPERS